MIHAVARLREQRLAVSNKPFRARGCLVERCPSCRVALQYCMCKWKKQIATDCGICLLMHDKEPLKPSNTGWLIADVVPDTFAFLWSRTCVDEKLLELLADPQWQPYVVFPEEYAEPEQVVHSVTHNHETGKKPLFIILDATWLQARKIFRKSPYLANFPVLSFQPEHLSQYQLRRSNRDDHLCTVEVGVLCLELAQELEAQKVLENWFARFTKHYLAAKKPPSKDQQEAYFRELPVTEL